MVSVHESRSGAGLRGGVVPAAGSGEVLLRVRRGPGVRFVVLIDVDPTGPVPVYEQVRSQLAEMIRTGALPAGFRLAPIRQLAADLALAPGTVARVYRELEADGLVVSRVRHGTVVAELSRQARTDTQQVLADSARTYAAVAARLGLTLEDALGVVRDQWSVAGQGSVAPDGP